MLNQSSPEVSFSLQVIQEAIDVFQRKNETFKLASKELNVEDPVSCHMESDGGH